MVFSFEINSVSRMVAEIFCVIRLGNHIPVENALIPIFVLGGKIVAFST